MVTVCRTPLKVPDQHRAGLQPLAGAGRRLSSARSSSRSFSVALSWPPKAFSCSRQASVLSSRSCHMPFGTSRRNSADQAAFRSASAASRKAGKSRQLWLQARRTGRFSSGRFACPEPRSIRARCPVGFDVAVRHGCDHIQPFSFDPRIIPKHRKWLLGQRATHRSWLVQG